MPHFKPNALIIRVDKFKGNKGFINLLFEVENKIFSEIETFERNISKLFYSLRQ